MPIITTPLRPNDSGPAVADLHRALLKFGTPIADAEKTVQQFGDSTLAAVLAFRNQHGLPAVERNASPFDETVGRLLNVAAAAADGKRAALRIAVRESVAAARTAIPQENYWLARYAVIAFDYPTARSTALRSPQLSDLVNAIIKAPPDRGTQPPEPPEIPYPENFYTYRYNLLPQEQLDELLALAAAALSETSAGTLQVRRVTGTGTPQRPGGSSAPAMQLRKKDRDEQSDWPEDFPGDEPDPDPLPSEQPTDPARQRALLESADSWLRAVNNWQFGNKEFNNRRYASAVSAFTACQQDTLKYFSKYYDDVVFVNPLETPPLAPKTVPRGTHRALR